MNADFHYYATYLASRLAKYDHKDSLKIAYAAAFVDYFDYQTLQMHPYVNWHLGEATLTSQAILEMLEIAVRRLPTCDIYKYTWPNYVFEMWAAFHFLPGNEDLKIKYTGVDNHSEQFDCDSWSYDKRCKETFKLLCTNNSNLAVNMINDIKRANIKDNEKLHLIGLRMHVLADTWAHQYFSATGQWFLNDTDKDIYEFPEGEKSNRKVGWLNIENIEDLLNKIFDIDDKDDAFTQNIFFAIPSVAPFYDHMAELGHGRMGHLPDYSGMTYTYRPQWSKDYITRDGVEVFTHALAQLAEALCCIKENRTFSPETYHDLNDVLSDENKKTLFNSLLKTKKVDLSVEWQKIIKNVFGFIETIPPFNSEKWYNEAPYIGNDYDLAYFNHVAKYHKDFVIRYLKEKNLYPNISSTFEHPCFLKTSHTPNKYISTAKISDGYFYADFEPQLGKGNKIILRIVKQDSSPLKSGDIVEIKTAEPTKSGNEHRVADKPYLTAFKEKIMYGTQGYRSNAQRWKIEICGNGNDIEITNEVQIKIQNIFFKNKSYLSPKEGSDGLLTLTEEPYIWTFENCPKEFLIFI